MFDPADAAFIQAMVFGAFGLAAAAVLGFAVWATVVVVQMRRESRAKREEQGGRTPGSDPHGSAGFGVAGSIPPAR